MIRRFLPDEWRTYRELRLRALADAPEAFGSSLAREQGRTDDEWASRLAASPDLDLPLVAEVAGAPVGLAWGKIGDSREVAHVYQMWVAPEFRGRGIGQMLLDAIIDWARSAKLEWLVLGVTSGNSSAMRLYLRAGFLPFGEPEALWPDSPAVAQEMRLRLTG